MSETDQMDHYVNRIHELTARNDELERRNAELFAQIEIAQKISDEIGIIGMVASPAWAGQMKQLVRPEMLEAEIVERLGNPVAYGERFGTPYQSAWCIPDTGVPPWMAATTPLYRLPSPLATSEERIKEGRI